MLLLRVILVIMFLSIMYMNIVVIPKFGLNITSDIVNPIKAKVWQGQFNVDFLCYLILSSVWVMGRHKFTLKGIVLGIFAALLGITFFAPYLLIITFTEKGDFCKILTGNK